ncbi:TPA: alpha/beta hydrolase [Bacillus cereus]|nr:alpha/beta hydrolase [Bacillus cereus]
MNHYTVEFGRYQASVCEWGDKRNPQIICFHGLGSTKLSFIELAEVLKDKYYIVSFDLPGHGKSPSFEKDEDYGAPHLINWIVGLLARIGKNEFHILAHSWGASIALHYAAECPEKVGKMILLDGGYHNFEMNDSYFAELYKDEKEGDVPPRSLAESIAYYKKDFDEYIFDNDFEFIQSEKESYTRWSPLLEVAVKELMREDDGKIRWHATGDTARGAIKFQYAVYETLKFKKISSDLLLLYCDLPAGYLDIRELMIKEFGKQVAVTTKLYKDTGHLMYWERPNEIANDIISWMR